jgi:molybdopterin converting factor small subunit
MTSAAPSVTVLLFASAREAVGRPRLDWPVPKGGLRAEALIRALADAYPRLKSTLQTSRFVRNGQYLEDLETKVRPGDEFAVHPPYGGG